jgi:hypothetical protein
MLLLLLLVVLLVLGMMDAAATVSAVGCRRFLLWSWSCPSLVVHVVVVAMDFRCILKYCNTKHTNSMEGWYCLVDTDG